MACVLSPSLGGKEDFVAPAGADVTLALKAPKGVKAEIVHLRYDQDPADSSAPFQFTVKKGARMLVVLAEASQPGALLQLVEPCDEAGATQVVDRFHFDPMNPARGYIVRGTDN